MIKKQEKIQLIANVNIPSFCVCEAGVQGPLKGPGSSGYFRSSVVVSDAFLTPIFPGRSELLLCFFFLFFFIIGLRENKECKAQTIQTILGSPAIL